MSIHLPDEQEAELRHVARTAGRTVDELAAEVIARFLEEESRRAELVALLDEGERDLARGDALEFGSAEALGAFFDQVKREGADRMARASVTRRDQPPG